MQNNRNKMFKFSVVMFLVYASHAIMFTQMIPYLTQLGYTGTQRGYILSYFAVVSIAGQILVGYLSDRFGAIKRFFIYTTFILFMTGLMAFSFDGANYWFHFFVVGTMAGFTRIASNLYDTWVLETDGLYHEFGRIRSLGSLGWALTSLVGGYLATSMGFHSIGILSGVLSLCVIFLSFRLEEAKTESPDPIKFKDMAALFQNKNYVLLLVVYFVAYFVYNADGITVIDLIFDLGGNASNVGTKWFVQAISEIPMMIIMGRLLIKYRGKKLMIFASVITAMRFFLYAMAPSVTSILIMTALQMLSYPFLLISQKDLVYREVPEHLRSTGQMVAISITIGLSAVFTPIFAATIVEMTTIRTALTVFGLLMVIPATLMLFYKPDNHTV